MFVTDCENLNREQCQYTANTCGACQKGFAGEDGDFNTLCNAISTDEAFDSSLEAANDLRPVKVCPGIVGSHVCSGHGECITVDGVRPHEFFLGKPGYKAPSDEWPIFDLPVSILL